MCNLLPPLALAYADDEAHLFAQVLNGSHAAGLIERHRHGIPEERLNDNDARVAEEVADHMVNCRELALLDAHPCATHPVGRMMGVPNVRVEVDVEPPLRGVVVAGDEIAVLVIGNLPCNCIEVGRRCLAAAHVVGVGLPEKLQRMCRLGAGRDDWLVERIETHSGWRLEYTNRWSYTLCSVLPI